MQAVTLAGQALPPIGQGTWRMGEDPSRRQDEIAALRLGLELGLKVIDTAEMYGEGEAEREDRAQPARDDHDPVAAVAGDEARGEAGTREAAECRYAEGETVLPGREVVFAQQKNGQKWDGGHDQAGHQDRVEEQAP